MKAQAIAVDLGGTKLRAARLNHMGQILDQIEVPTKATAGAEVVLDQIAQLVTVMKNNAADAEIIGVGVCAPGPLDTKLGLALSIPTIRGFENYPMLAALENLLAMPVCLENDAIAAAIGEWKFGAGVGFENLVYVTVSTGIGGGVIADGKVLRGRMGMAGHIGHMVIAADGELCKCGNRGCFEAYASGPAFAARAQKRATYDKNTVLGKKPQPIDSRSVFTAARAGDLLALELIAEEAKILATGFVSLAHLYSPDMIIMGGGLSHEFDSLAPPILLHFRANVMKAFQDTALKNSILAGNSGLVGASWMLFERFNTSK